MGCVAVTATIIVAQSHRLSSRHGPRCCWRAQLQRLVDLVSWITLGGCRAHTSINGGGWLVATAANRTRLSALRLCVSAQC